MPQVGAIEQPLSSRVWLEGRVFRCVADSVLDESRGLAYRRRVELINAYAVGGTR